MKCHELNMKIYIFFRIIHSYNRIKLPHGLQKKENHSNTMGALTLENDSTISVASSKSLYEPKHGPSY